MLMHSNGVLNFLNYLTKMEILKNNAKMQLLC